MPEAFAEADGSGQGCALRHVVMDGRASFHWLPGEHAFTSHHLTLLGVSGHLAIGACSPEQQGQTCPIQRRGATLQNDVRPVALHTASSGSVRPRPRLPSPHSPQI